MSPGWQSRALQMASRVVKRTAFGLVGLQDGEVGHGHHHLLGELARDIFRLASITSRFTTIGTAIPPLYMVRSFSSFSSAAFRTRWLSRKAATAMANPPKTAVTASSSTLGCPPVITKTVTVPTAQ